MADGFYLWVSCQLLLNKFLDPSTPSMRKVEDGGGKEIMILILIMSEIVATNIVAS